MQRVGAACTQYGKSFGRIYEDTETGVALHDIGVDFLCYSGDAWLVQRGVAEGIAALRKACRGRAWAPPAGDSLEECAAPSRRTRGDHQWQSERCGQ